MFLREYKVIESGVNVDQLRKKLKSEELEQYGDSFTPSFVYDAVKGLPRFASMEVRPFNLYCLINFGSLHTYSTVTSKMPRNF
jgi:hypothetical protein